MTVKNTNLNAEFGAELFVTGSLLPFISFLVFLNVPVISAAN